MIPVLIIPILTKPELLYALLDSINYPVGHLVVIDNGGCVDTSELTEHADEWCREITHLPLPTNLGVAAAWNLGIKLTPHAPWWMVSNFDVTFGGNALEMFDHMTRRDRVTLSHDSPEWCCFTVGDEVVAKVGLFDEGFYPAYFEDWDYRDRCNAAELPVRYTDIRVGHANSSTLAHFPHRNDISWPSNEAYYRDKVARADRSEGRWSITRRRANSWD